MRSRLYEVLFGVFYLLHITYLFALSIFFLRLSSCQNIKEDKQGGGNNNVKIKQGLYTPHHETALSYATL